MVTLSEALEIPLLSFGPCLSCPSPRTVCGTHASCPVCHLAIPPWFLTAACNDNSCNHNTNKIRIIIIIIIIIITIMIILIIIAIIMITACCCPPKMPPQPSRSHRRAAGALGWEAGSPSSPLLIYCLCCLVSYYTYIYIYIYVHTYICLCVCLFCHHLRCLRLCFTSADDLTCAALRLGFLNLDALPRVTKVASQTIRTFTNMKPGI